MLIPDESGYLLAARLITGGAAGDLSGRTFYQAGYPLVLTPAYWLSSDPATVYRLVILINALVGASVFALAYIALRRLDLPRGRSYLLATVTALLPSQLYYGQFAMSDAVLPVAVLGWLLLVHAWITSGRFGYGVVASLVAAYTYCVHGRGAVIVVAHAGLLAAVLWRRWASKRDIVVTANALVAGSAAAWALNGWVKSRIYRGGVQAHGEWLLHRLTSLDGLGWTIGLTAGKIWYLIVSTWGVAGVGLVALGVVAVRRRTPPATRAVACLTLATVVGIALAMSAATADEKTVANFAYGRYLSCLAPVVFLAGAAFATRCTRRAAVWAVLACAGLAFATAGIVRVQAGGRLSTQFFGTADFPEICVLTWNWNALQLWFATWVALVLLILAALIITSGGRDGWRIVAVGFIALDLTVMAVSTERETRAWEDRIEAATSLAPAGLRPQDHVAVNYVDLSWRIWVSQAFQVRNGLKAIDRFRRETLAPDVTLVIVPWDLGKTPRQSWPAAPPNWRPVSIRQSYAGDWVAWRRMG
ncbi:hypothetical protein [Actinoallomurus iriomotensis]|uniref:Uncharacterized protein n=1 Tax=Actinoallomurus iriomotensis TaxID=478107 RepID=A0A9W6SI52_9ACTN|nr:hypothetical protein [Actinoallomurus iriomotensis]GLY92637.1 hypothetical protein Airi02_105650 [Actinoallomurus iriomotensis]